MNDLKGLDLCRSYYHEIINPLIKNSTSIIGDNYAAALIGWGSDVLGNDDELSRDHEWGPRCIIFLPISLEHYSKDLYNELNSKIPDEYKNYSTRFIFDNGVFRPSKNKSGNVHIEITTCDNYFNDLLGIITPDSDLEWLAIPENRLLEITSGEVFFDGFGELTQIRQFYLKYFPTNVWKYRLAYEWQSLGWNIDLIGLAQERGDTLSSKICLNITLEKIIKLIFLLNKSYAPSYKKWIHRQFYKLPHLSKEVGSIIEECYIRRDVKKTINQIKQVLELLIEYQNNIVGLPKVKMQGAQFSRGYFDLDLQFIADQIHATITGELKELPLYGAIDQWITNEDFLLNSDRMKSLSIIYNR